MTAQIDNLFGAALETGNPYAIAGAGAAKIVDMVIPQLGSGRREADIIVPVQNQLNQLLVAVNEEYPQASLARLYQLRESLNSNWLKFKTWVQSQQWTDGRAAQQAIDPTKDPAVTVAATLANINARIGSGGGAPTTAGGDAIPDNTLLYAGGALLAAKVLGFL